MQSDAAVSSAFAGLAPHSSAVGHRGTSASAAGSGASRGDDRQLAGAGTVQEHGHQL